VNELLDKPVPVLDLPPDLPLVDLIEAYGQYDVVFATRLHHALLALHGGVPAVAIAYEAKTPGILVPLGLGAWIADIESVAHEDLLEKLDELQRYPAEEVATALAGQHAELKRVLAEAYADRTKLPN
jgi:colanic acid/amylovoran biosynthesis protein